MKLLYEKHVPGSNSFSFPAQNLYGVPDSAIPSEHVRAAAPDLPELSEVEAVRHFTELSKRAFGVDDGMYPLGSCTMKYNPKINEAVARFSGFAGIHPYQPTETVQGALELIYKLSDLLAQLGGMSAATLQPAAGAHGESTGLMMIRAYHKSRGEDETRRVVLVPDSAHGTNPASATLVGYETRVVKSNASGRVDLDDLKSKLGPDVAAIMLTNPNTLGLFETDAAEITRLVHECGGLCYYDGANLNAIMGVARPGDMGFDVAHYNLHKTFSTPHGGGGPGACAVGVKEFLEPFLPTPVVVRKGEWGDCDYQFDYDRPQSIGKVKTFYGNFGVCVRAYAYILSLGFDGLKNACQNAVLNANYIRELLKDCYDVAIPGLCMHEFVCSPKKRPGAPHTLDVAKRLIDFGYHPPTIYFPLIVDEAIMIEPTETETKERIDEFVAVMKRIANERVEDPEQLFSAPHNAAVRRLDETKAARNPVLKYDPPKE